MNINRLESVVDKFLDEVMEKEVMQICWAFLNCSGCFLSDRKTFKDALRQIWFPDAFEHIFAGSASFLTVDMFLCKPTVGGIRLPQ